MNTTDVIVVGGGASGLMAAISAAEHGDKVCLLEAQNKVGRKILVSGNGRCNLMNLSKPRYYGDSDFASEVFKACPTNKILDFWNRYGLCLRTMEDGRVYPCTFQASSVLDILILAMKQNHISCFPNQKVIRISKKDHLFQVFTDSGEEYLASRIIVSTGSPAQPKLGGNDIAPQLLKDFGHISSPFSPALTPLITDARSVSGLAGIRVRCMISVYTNEREVHREKGELLFTEDGISGICVMQCARFITPGESICRLNLIHDLFADSEQAVQYLLVRKQTIPEEDPVNLIRGICLPKLAFAVCKQAGFSMRGQKIADLDESQIRALIDVLSGYTLHIKGRKGFDQAQVSAGGLECSLFNPFTMGSKLVSGLHVTGEALNVDGDCGGFNLMFAWSSGLLAGSNGRSMGCKKEI